MRYVDVDVDTYVSVDVNWNIYADVYMYGVWICIRIWICRGM